MARFAKIGIGADGTFDADTLSPEMRQASKPGWPTRGRSSTRFKKDKIDTGEVTSGEFFGTREHLNGNYLYRMAGAVLGIYGNSKQEAMYPVLLRRCRRPAADRGRQLHRALRPGQLPPVNAFWSLTMYELPESLLVANPINRYLINSPMLPDLVKDADGGLTLYIQNASPGPDKEANWLPAPGGTVHRRRCGCTGPSPMRSNGDWKAPAPVRA